MEIAVEQLSPEMLNTLCFSIAAHLGYETKNYAVAKKMEAELERERFFLLSGPDARQ